MINWFSCARARTQSSNEISFIVTAKLLFNFISLLYYIVSNKNIINAREREACDNFVYILKRACWGFYIPLLHIYSCVLYIYIYRVARQPTVYNLWHTYLSRVIWYAAGARGPLSSLSISGAAQPIGSFYAACTVRAKKRPLSFLQCILFSTYIPLYLCGISVGKY